MRIYFIWWYQIGICRNFRYFRLMIWDTKWTENTKNNVIEGKLEHYLRKYSESHHMQNLCQRIILSFLIHFLVTISISYLSQSLAISKCYPHYILNHSPISITIVPWLIICYYYYWFRLVCSYKWGIPQSYPETKMFLSTEMPHGRHREKVATGLQHQKVEERCKNFGTIATPSITINLKADLLFINFILLLYNFSRYKSEL